jgi:hypothetical protein
MFAHDDKIPVQVVVTLWLRDGCDVGEVIQDMDYDFKHPDILDMEIRDINTDI